MTFIDNIPSALMPLLRTQELMPSVLRFTVSRRIVSASSTTTLPSDPSATPSLLSWTTEPLLMKLKSNTPSATRDAAPKARLCWSTNSRGTFPTTTTRLIKISMSFFFIVVTSLLIMLFTGSLRRFQTLLLWINSLLTSSLTCSLRLKILGVV